MKIIEKQFTCIQCPVGCTIRVKMKINEENNLSETTNRYNRLNLNTNENKPEIILVKGNKCIRGKDYVKKEIINPERTITTTVATIFPQFPRLSVKTDKEVPLKQIFLFMEEINKIKIENEVKIGQIVKKNLLGTDINLIATSTIEIDNE